MYYDIDELVAFEVPIHKLMNVDVFIILSANKRGCH